MLWKMLEKEASSPPAASSPVPDPTAFNPGLLPSQCSPLLFLAPWSFGLNPLMYMHIASHSRCFGSRGVSSRPQTA